MFLADFGADVIKVERLDTGDVGREAQLAGGMHASITAAMSRAVSMPRALAKACCAIALGSDRSAQSRNFRESSSSLNLPG